MNNLYLSSLARQSRTNITSTNRGSRQRKSWLVDNRPSVLAQAKMVNSISCMQCELPEGASMKDTTAQVWLSKDVSKTDGILCNEIRDEEKKDTKSGALKKIAEKAAKIGKGCGDSSLHSDGKRWIHVNWETGESYNDITTEKINPFQVPITCEYLTKAKKREGREETESSNTVELKMKYHFGPYNNGYVVGVDRKNRKENSSEGEVTYSGHIFFPPEEGGTDGYDNTHVCSPDETILKATSRLKDGSRAGKYDAYTRLVGEGARFQCVRNNIETLKDNTYFYTTISPTSTNSKPKKVGILYKDLCKSWGDVFGQAFDIDNKRLIAALKDTSSPKEIRIRKTRIKNIEELSSTIDKIEL